MLASLISAVASGEAVAALGRARTMAIVYGVAALAALTGLGFLIGAAYIGPPDAMARWRPRWASASASS